MTEFEEIYKLKEIEHASCCTLTAARNYKCSVCLKWFCSYKCWLRHLFWHWNVSKTKFNVTAWLDIKEVNKEES